jgi:hypothetical protein
MYQASFGGAASIVPFASVPAFTETNPRSVVQINGTSYLPTTWSTTRNGHGATDDATITLPIKGNPDFSIELFNGPLTTDSSPANSGTTAPDDTPVYAQIFAGYPQDLTPGSLTTQGMTTRFLGVVDLYTVQCDDNTVSFTCRSLAAPLVDNKITNVALGMTSVQFAQALANALNLNTAITNFAQYGLTPITLQEMLGREFIGGSNFNTALYNLKPWDVLLQCAQFDDADVWVDGDTLNYQVADFVQRKKIALGYGSGGIAQIVKPVLTHSIQFSKNIRVEVRSYQRKTRLSTVTRTDTAANGGVILTQSSKTVTSAPIFGTPNTVSSSTNPATGITSTTESSSSGGNVSSGFTSPGSESGKETYKIYRPNISPAAANALAQALWRKYSEQEYALSFSVPMSPALFSSWSITALLEITGLPYSEFNTEFYPRRYTESWNPEGDGWMLSPECVNHVLAQGSV